MPSDPVLCSAVLMEVVGRKEQGWLLPRPVSIDLDCARADVGSTSILRFLSQFSQCQFEPNVGVFFGTSNSIELVYITVNEILIYLPTWSSLILNLHPA